MNLWIAYAVIAQVFQAVVALFDRKIVKNPSFPKPFAYAFWVSLLSASSIFVLILGTVFPFSIGSFEIPSLAKIVFPSQVGLILLFFVGYIYFFSLYLMFLAFQKTPAVDVVPIVGAVSAVSILFADKIVNNTFLPDHLYIAIFLMVLGTLFVSGMHLSKKTVLFAVSSGVLFGIHSLFFKLLFSEMQSFDNVFMWTRISYVLATLTFLIFPKTREIIKTKSGTGNKTKSVSIILSNKALAGAAGILTLKAQELGDISIVQALGGMQYVFLFLFSLNIFHQHVKEGNKKEARKFFYRLVSITLISVGFLFLFV